VLEVVKGPIRNLVRADVAAILAELQPDDIAELGKMADAMNARGVLANTARHGRQPRYCIIERTHGVMALRPLRH
jgi:hypothetical protein